MAVLPFASVVVAGDSMLEAYGAMGKALDVCACMHLGLGEGVWPEEMDKALDVRTRGWGRVRRRGMGNTLDDLCCIVVKLVSASADAT